VPSTSFARGTLIRTFFLHDHHLHRHAGCCKVTGRYICLIRGESDDTNRYLADDSLVEMSKELVDHQIDWVFVENALHETGIFSI